MADVPINGVVDVPLAQTGEGIAECELLKWFVQEVSGWFLLVQCLCKNSTSSGFVWVLLDDFICWFFSWIFFSFNSLIWFNCVCMDVMVWLLEKHQTVVVSSTHTHCTCLVVYLVTSLQLACFTVLVISLTASWEPCTCSNAFPYL